MTHVFERLQLHCPYVRARHYLPDILESGAIGTLPVQRSVSVRFKRGRDPLCFDDPWQAYWTADGGNYPEFRGEVTVRVDISTRSAVLEIYGDYWPPFGDPAKGLDIITGAHTTSATARTLLERIAAEMEARYEVEEAAG